MNSHSRSRFIIGEALAVVFGLIASGLLSLTGFGGAMLSAFVFVSPIFMAFLYGFSGLVPAFTMGGVMFIGSYAFGGLYWAVCAAFCGILPGAIMVMASYKGIAFFKQLSIAIVSIIIFYVMALGLVYLLEGKDFPTLMTESFRGSFDIMSQETKDLFAQLIRDTGMIDPEAVALQTTDGLIEVLITDMEAMLRISLPATVIIMAFINSAFGVLWMNFLRIRSGQDNVSFVPVAGWRLSKEVSIGVFVITIAVNLMSGAMGDYALPATMMVSCALTLFMLAQAAASLLSRMKLVGMTVAKRTVFTVLLLVFGGQFIFMYGIASALFGSRGIFRFKKSTDKENPEHGEEE